MPSTTKTFILNDTPIESIQNDSLDFSPYAQALADIIMTGSTPLTIGVFGTWGSGKTSLMRMVKEQAEEQGAVVGWFDAWKYDKEETLWRAFLLSVLFSLEAAAKKNNQAIEEIEKLKNLLYQPIDIEKLGGVTIDLVKLSGKAVQGAVQLGLSFIPGGATLGKIVEELQKAGVENLSDEALDAIQRERTKIHIEQVRFLEQFQDRFHKIVTESVIRNQNGRLVVFVDDLDRCLPEKAIEVLEAIKLFMDVPGCIFVLGLDQEVIARGVELRYKEFFKEDEQNPINGAKYLEKIIQLPFQIPPVERADMQDFVNGLSADWPHEDCPKIFTEGLSDNPRQIKRAVNVFLMLWNLAERRKHKLQGQIKPIRLAKIVAIQFACPELYSLLKDEPKYIKDLEDYYQTKKISETTLGNENEILEIPSLPPVLQTFLGKSSIERILIPNGTEKNYDASFNTLVSDEIRLYFTLTRRIATQIRTSTNLSIEPQMVRIPSGCFLVGSSETQVAQFISDGIDKDIVEREFPQCEIELPEYFIGKYLVTNLEYREFIRDTKYRSPIRWNGDDYPEGESDHPVVNISWISAVAYTNWLSQKTGNAYRLPTEFEWEKAARGEHAYIYPWGNNANFKNANLFETGIGKATPVGNFSPQGDSLYGCADMIGNVWEWCFDWFDANRYKKTSRDGGLLYQDNTSESYRVIRGGSYINSVKIARCASRNRLQPYDSDDSLGFRVAFSPQK